MDHHKLAAELLSGPSFDVIADPRGTAVYMIQTAPGTPVMQGVAERVSN